MADYQRVKFGMQDGIAVIAIDHPPANAFDTQTIDDLENAFDEATADPTVRVIIITGHGQFAFAAGADLKEMQSFIEGMPTNGTGPAEETVAESREYIRRGQVVFNKIEASKKPVIAAVNALALGGGLELAMACHIRIASDKARFGQPEINLGIIPAWGGTQRLPRLIGKGKAIELILTGDPISAQEAYRLGLINKVVPATSLLREAMGLAKKLTEKGALALAAALNAINAGVELPLEEALDCELDQFASLMVTNDVREGLQAFIQKRKPQFTGT